LSAALHYLRPLACNKEMSTEQKKPHPMDEHLVQKLKECRQKRAFNVVDWTEKKCAMINDYMKKSGLKAAVVNASGGVDSSCTLALLKHAQKMEGSPIEKILAIAQPIHSTKSIQDRAYEVCTAMGVEIVTVDQTDLHKMLSVRVGDALKMEPNAFANGNLRSYMRTPVAFFVAQILSCNGFPCIVMGTGNQDEDGYLRYFCKAGDGVADVQLIADLHKSEVFTVSAHLKVPESVLIAPPSADLWDGQTDEGELGVTYDFVELYTEWLQYEPAEQEAFLTSLPEASKAFFLARGADMKAIHDRNKHKIHCPLNLNIIPCKLQDMKL